MSNETRTESLAFLEYALERVVLAAGGSAQHAKYVAQAISFAHIQGKLNQGLGVYEVIDLALKLGVLDMSATPEVINEGPAWAVVDGHGSSGYYALNVMADIAIEKARTSGIAIAYGGNHNDAGSFASYVYKAHEQDMMAMASNNTPPLAAPFGGMQNLLSCPPFDAIVPSGTEPPIWASLKFAEFYDADISEAVLHHKPMNGKWLIDPASGELSDNPAPYAMPFEGYGRVWGYSCGGQIETSRTYALNLWNEGMTAIANPIGIPVNQISSTDEFMAALDGKSEATTTVGGSYYLCINPGVFGPIAAVKAKSDDFVTNVRQSKARPGHRVRIPGETAYNNLAENNQTIEVLTNHWQPFFENIAGQYGLSEKSIRADFEALAQ
ncbi:MAG: malate/L-lactate dehydrogenase subfamily protein [Gammaproteobacteria bacterium]|nr:malate/L-lactate dehydrogenase subfamily protein [Gammaproteobacteria bacterium]